MPLRAKASAVAIAALACLLLAPAAMASSGSVQVTGKQLKSALLPVLVRVGYRGNLYVRHDHH